MLNFVHNIPTKVYFGKGSISHLADELKKYGNNVLLAYGSGSIKKMGLYDEVVNILKQNGFTYFELKDIKPNPRVESVIEGVNICKSQQISVILAVGGGSVIDCAKAIAVGTYEEGDVWNNIVSRKPGQLGKALPLIDILTLSATGSEFDNGGVISNLATNEKLGRCFTFPSVSICDPTYTYSVNKYQTAAGSADIMSHTMEDYFARENDNDIIDELGESLLRNVMKYCKVALDKPDDYVARANLMMASSVACSGIPMYGKEFSGWAVHQLEHELSAYYDITHGVGLAILTPRWMKYILKKDPSITPRFARFAKKVFNLKGFNQHLLAIRGISALEKFFKSIGIPMTLKELKIDETHFVEMAKHVTKISKLASAYVPLNEEDVVNIFKASL